MKSKKPNFIETRHFSKFMSNPVPEQDEILLQCLSFSHVVVPGWEDEDVLIVGFTEEPPRKRRKVTDEGVCPSEALTSLKKGMTNNYMVSLNILEESHICVDMVGGFIP